jgi:RNA polymerase sigma-70 factor (ECF subfamily)
VTDSRQDKAASQSPDVTQRAFEEFGGELQRFLTRRLRCAHTARDLAQDVYLRFMLVSRREGIRKPQAFLYQLASNLIYKYATRQRHTQVVYDSDLLEAADQRTAVEADADPGDRLSSAQELERILKPLPKVYRAVLLMRKRDGLSPEEIAQRLGFSKKTVYEYLTRAIAQVKEARLER